jgi:hypothetical protein
VYIKYAQESRGNVWDGLLVATRENLKRKDATVAVDARSDAEAGIVLRLQDAGTYLLAIYANQSLYFHETLKADGGPMLDRVPAEGFGPTIHLTAEVVGDTATFTVSDGQKTVTTSHRIQNFPEAGAFGLFHNRSGGTRSTRPTRMTPTTADTGRT